MAEDTPIRKIRDLPPERVAEVEDFVDFLMARGSQHLKETTRCRRQRGRVSTATPGSDRDGDHKSRS